MYELNYYVTQNTNADITRCIMVTLKHNTLCMLYADRWKNWGFRNTTSV